MTAAEQDDLFGQLLQVVRALKRVSPPGPVDGPMLGFLLELRRLAPVRHSDLAAAIGLDASTVSRHVSALGREGWVAREPDPGDGRASRLALTEAGEAVLEEAVSGRRYVLDEATRGWKATERSELARLLHRLAVDLETHTTRKHTSPERVR